MIDTKIACQCGNRFKFGMDLVNGRAPDGLVCPTCGAPATAACNALVDFLSGKEPAPAASGPRPVKEVKVTCTCGARYKFDLELAEKEMPSPVQCPGCQVDLTPLANEEIRNYRTKHAVDLAGATVAAPVPAAATLTTPTPESVAPPTVAAPVVASVPAASPPASPDNTTAASPPAMPVAAPAVTAPTPTAAPTPAVAPAPAVAPSTAPAAPVAPIATPVLDPFGPAPTGKSTGPNLRPLEAPKITRPAPGTAPTKPAAPASPASAPKSAKPDSAKPDAAKPAAKAAAKPAPAASSREPSLALGVAGAVGGAVIGAGIWFAVLKSTGLNGGFMAPVLGILAGFGARLLGRGASPTLGGVACISAGLAIGVMAWLAMSEHVNRQMRPQLKGHYDRSLAAAKEAAAAKTDAELKLVVARSSMNSDPDGSRVTDADLKVFRTMRLPKMLELATGKVTREQFESRQLAEWRASSDWMDVWQESLGMFGLLMLIAGVGAAARIALR